MLLPGPFLKEPMSRQLVGERMVHQHIFGKHECRRLLKQTEHSGGGSFLFLFGEKRLAGFDPGADVVFIGHDLESTLALLFAEAPGRPCGTAGSGLIGKAAVPLSSSDTARSTLLSMRLTISK